MIRQEDASRAPSRSALPLEAQLRIRDELHALQVGLNLLRKEMLSGDYRGADLTYGAIQHCLRRLSNDDVLAATRSDAVDEVQSSDL